MGLTRRTSRIARARPARARKARPAAPVLADMTEFQQKVTRWVSQPGGWHFALLLIYLDEIRGINETLGHAQGQRLMEEAARRVRDALGKDELVGVLLAGHLAVLVRVSSSVHSAEAAAKSILEAMREPIKLAGTPLRTSLSIGAALCPEHAQLLPDLLRRALIAQSYARRRGGGRFRIYEPQMGERVKRRWSLGTKLQRAHEREEFTLAYQPHVDGKTDRIVGVETLLRWTDAELGPQAPAEFVPVLEQGSLMVPVGNWVLRSACAQAQVWRKAGYGDLTLSVNLSPRQIDQPELVETVAAILEETGFPARNLLLEITETMLLRDLEQTRASIEALFVLGVRTAIDDFGTGYSSLSYLKHLPVWALKIDRQFVAGLPSSHDDVMITESIISLAERFKLATIAEGVETAAQATFLRQRGITWMQGYHFRRPLPAAELEPVLRTQAGL